MDTQDILLTIFTGILALAVLMQALIYFGILKTIRRLSEKMDGLSKEVLKNVEMVSEKTNETLTVIQEIGDGFVPIKDKVVDAADILHSRVLKIDDFLEETTSTARLEVLKAKSRIESASDSVEQMLEDVRTCIMTPVNEICALTRGIRAAFDLLFRRRRPSSSVPDQDEEMFI
ncbi:MAG: hypothetical protein P8Z37_07725 [Acidobacteriota bacterium]